MHMSFWWDYVQENFLFSGYNIHTAGGFLSTCLGLTSLAIFLEFLKLLQARHRQKEIFCRARQIRTICPSTESSKLLVERRELSRTLTMFTRFQMILWEIFLWLNLQVFGYLLMLVVMGYNGWMVISIILGSGIGYFCFAPCLVKIQLENSQVIRETFCTANCGETEQDGETTPALQASTSSITTPQNETQAFIHHSVG